MPDRLPTRFLTRATATARIATHLGRAGARRLVRRSADDDAVLGEGLFTELDRLKGLAMKVGQILSYMDVGLPDETVARLVGLQRGVTPLAPDVIAAEFERELGAPLAELFDRFDPIPVAAASVGQVHRAALRGAEVAVKVRYPGVRETLDADTRQLGAIAGLASLATAVDGQALVRELRDRLLEECDYALEAERQARFASFLAGDPDLVVPEVVADRCSTGVLTSAWHDGDRFEALAGEPASRRSAVARTLVRFPWTTLLRGRVLHADPHPGNFLFPREGVVVVLDFGCVRTFSVAEVDAFRGLVRAVLDGRRAELPERAAAIGLVPRPERVDFDALWDMLAWLLAPYARAPFRFDRAWWEAGRRFSRPGEPNARHLAFPPHWLWIQRTLFGLHAVLVRLGAEGDFAAVVRPSLDLGASGA